MSLDPKLLSSAQQLFQEAQFLFANYNYPKSLELINQIFTMQELSNDQFLRCEVYLLKGRAINLLPNGNFEEVIDLFKKAYHCSTDAGQAMCSFYALGNARLKKGIAEPNPIVLKQAKLDFKLALTFGKQLNPNNSIINERNQGVLQSLDIIQGHLNKKSTKNITGIGSSN